MTDIDPEGFYRCPDPLCVCGPLYTYAGHIEPGGYAEDCPLHGNPRLFYDEMDRLRAGIESEHGPVQEFEPCPTEWKGCDDPACTESAHDGGLYHADQPVGHVCLTCRDEDGAPLDWPCATAALLNPTEGESHD